MPSLPSPSAFVAGLALPSSDARLLLTFSALSERAHTRLTAGVAGSVFALLALLAVQVLRTRPLLTFDPLTATLLGASAFTLVALYARTSQAALRGFRTTA